MALAVTWVDIANPNPAGTTSTAVFNQGRPLGGARFRRLEGCWWGNGAVYFADDQRRNAGPVRSGSSGRKATTAR